MTIATQSPTAEDKGGGDLRISCVQFVLKSLVILGELDHPQFRKAKPLVRRRWQDRQLMDRILMLVWPSGINAV